MANLTETSQWEAGVYQIETTDPVIGGTDGISNQQAKQLANRTKYLKDLAEALGIGKQPLDETLTALAALVGATDKIPYFNGADSAALTTLTAFARTLIDDADAATARTTLGVDTAIASAVATLVNSSPATLDTLAEIATALGNDPNFATSIATLIAGKQPLDATLSALAGITVAANKLIYATGGDAFATTDLSAFMRTLLDDTDAATACATLGISVRSGHTYTANDWAYLPGGLILQWGSFTGLAGDSTTLLTLPVAFSSQFINGLVGGVGSNNSGSLIGMQVVPGSSTLTQIAIRNENNVSDGSGQFFAIGR